MNKDQVRVETKERIEITAEEALELLTTGHIEDEDTVIMMRDPEFHALISELKDE